MRWWTVYILLISACRQTPAQHAIAADTTVAPVDTYRGPKACDLITTADARQITNIPYDSAITINDYMGDSQCKIIPADTMKSSIMVSLHAKGRLEPYQKVPNTIAVKSLGDSAVWNDGNAQMAVARDSAVFSISFLKPPAKQSWGKRLAGIALQKL